VIGLSPSTYYYKPKRPRQERETADADLRDKIELVQAEYSCWGYRTVQTHLDRHYGLCVNHKRIRRVMRKYDLLRRIKRRFICTTDSNHGYRVYPNLLKGREITGINQVWVSDITYIRILTGFVFLAVILDVFSRRVIGWALSKHIDHELTGAALRMAIAIRNPEPDTIHHSDRGAQYACTEYVDILKEYKFLISMSAAGNPYDNAYAESFMKTLKNEEVYLEEYVDFADVVERVPQFIEAVYNRKRVHSGINYLPPEEFEAILQDEKMKHKLGQITLKFPD
jgi:transposase InsO family protein